MLARVRRWLGLGADGKGGPPRGRPPAPPRPAGPVPPAFVRPPMRGVSPPTDRDLAHVALAPEGIEDLREFVAGIERRIAALEALQPGQAAPVRACAADGCHSDAIRRSMFCGDHQSNADRDFYTEPCK